MSAKSRPASHWETLTDEQLLDTELETDKQDALAGMIDYLPDGYSNAFVEFKYDLRGTGSDEFVCVHGRHRHLAGFVMNKDGLRFKFGWKCAEYTYGASFEVYKVIITRRRTARYRPADAGSTCRWRQKSLIG